ncbi:MAG: hypothetical protein Q7T55_09355 [Solirubrobacteraceae bacterium]|nr:hypothetical protein [Solirubrobacteraceae bacterium]
MTDGARRAAGGLSMQRRDGEREQGVGDARGVQAAAQPAVPTPSPMASAIVPRSTSPGGVALVTSLAA